MMYPAVHITFVHTFQADDSARDEQTFKAHPRTNRRLISPDNNDYFVSAAIGVLTSMFSRHKVGSKPTSAQGLRGVDPGLIRLWGSVAGSTLDYPWIIPGLTLE